MTRSEHETLVRQMEDKYLTAFRYQKDAYDALMAEHRALAEKCKQQEADLRWLRRKLSRAEDAERTLGDMIFTREGESGA